MSCGPSEANDGSPPLDAGATDVAVEEMGLPDAGDVEPLDTGVDASSPTALVTFIWLGQESTPLRLPGDEENSVEEYTTLEPWSVSFPPHEVETSFTFFKEGRETVTLELDEGRQYVVVIDPSDRGSTWEVSTALVETDRTTLLHTNEGLELRVETPAGIVDVASGESVALDRGGTVDLYIAGSETPLRLGGDDADVLVLGGIWGQSVSGAGEQGGPSSQGYPDLRLLPVGGGEPPPPPPERTRFRVRSLVPPELPTAPHVVGCSYYECAVVPQPEFCGFAALRWVQGAVNHVATLSGEGRLLGLTEVGATEEVDRDTTFILDDALGRPRVRTMPFPHSLAFHHWADGYEAVEVFDESGMQSVPIGTVEYGASVTTDASVGTPTRIRVVDSSMQEVWLDLRNPYANAPVVLFDRPAGLELVRLAVEGGCVLHGPAVAGESCSTERACDIDAACFEAPDFTQTCWEVCADDTDCSAGEGCWSSVEGQAIGVATCRPESAGEGTAVVVVEEGPQPAELSVPLPGTSVVVDFVEAVTVLTEYPGGVAVTPPRDRTELTLYDEDRDYALVVAPPGEPIDGGLRVEEQTGVYPALVRRTLDGRVVAEGEIDIELVPRASGGWDVALSFRFVRGGVAVLPGLDGAD